MPLDDIHVVLQAPDVETRNRVIANHLARLESSLARTQEAVASLRGLLADPGTAASRSTTAMSPPRPPLPSRTLSTRPRLWPGTGEPWAKWPPRCPPRTSTRPGPSGGIFDTELFTEDRGRVTIFLPCDPLPQPVGRISTTVIPPAELATIVHLGSSTEVDRTYGALADYVTQHELAADGPIREYYLVGSSDTPDESLWRTEVGWPIFQTRPRA
jgi:hypothetical protein